MMDFVETLLNLLASMATIGALFFLTPLYTFLKAFCYIYTSISKEDVAGKVVLIVGASSGIGEDINFWGYVYMTYLSIPHLRRSKGKIVVIASSASWMPAPRMSLYNASKAAVVSFYESLRMELGSEVGITIVTPGLTESEMTRGKIMNKDGEMVVDQDLRDAEMSIVPIRMAATTAWGIVEGACRGDVYLAVPWWVQTTVYWVAFFPELVEWVNHWFLYMEPGASPLDAPSKKLLDVPGLRHVSQPSSAWSSELKE